MTSCAIVEQADISQDTRFSSTNAVRGHEVVFSSAYASGGDFGGALAAAIRTLSSIAVGGEEGLRPSLQASFPRVGPHEMSVRRWGTRRNLRREPPGVRHGLGLSIFVKSCTRRRLFGM